MASIDWLSDGAACSCSLSSISNDGGAWAGDPSCQYYEYSNHKTGAPLCYSMNETDFTYTGSYLDAEMADASVWHRMVAALSGQIPTGLCTSQYFCGANLASKSSGAVPHSWSCDGINNGELKQYSGSSANW